MRWVLGLLIAPALLAQSLEFEVASIREFKRPAPPDPNRRVGVRGGPGTDSPTRITGQSVSHFAMVLQAFDVQRFQVGEVYPGREATVFDVATVVPEGSTRQQVRRMWLNLLIKRFGFKYHIEQREFDIDELVVAPRGHKLKENDEPPPEGNPSAKFHFAAGRMVLDTPGSSMAIGGGGNGPEVMIAGRAHPLSWLVERLTDQFAHPVIDKTGLTARYDYYLAFTPPQV